MNQAEAIALVTKHGSHQKAATAAGLAKSTIFKYVHGKLGGGQPRSTRALPAQHPSTRKGRSLTEFKQTYDKDTIVPAKIKAGIKELGASGWAYENEFAHIAGLSLADLGNYRDRFADYVVSIRERRAWAGSTATAKSMREML